jgi:very-short-patch-repair endonuclease
MYKDYAPKPSSVSLMRGRKLRKQMTMPEVMLWRLLRGKPQGLKFRREHPSGGIVMDFYCSDARLCIEIDGISHEMSDRPSRDIERDNLLRSLGIDTIRIAAKDVLKDPIGTADSIVTYARTLLPLHPPAALDGPPPRDKLGEDEGR